LQARKPYMRLWPWIKFMELGRAFRFSGGSDFYIRFRARFVRISRTCHSSLGQIAMRTLLDT